MDVLLSQRCGKILVGDPHQQIYTFKGAVNALHIVDHTHIFYLTQVYTKCRCLSSLEYFSLLLTETKQKTVRMTQRMMGTVVPRLKNN